jgi:putative membrane protein insertion efficiency factor
MITSLIKKIWSFILFFYRNVIRNFFIILGIKGECVFYPSCSEYSSQAFQKYNPLKALYLTIRRVIRCHPGRPYTHDPLV